MYKEDISSQTTNISFCKEIYNNNNFVNYYKIIFPCLLDLKLCSV